MDKKLSSVKELSDREISSVSGGNNPVTFPELSERQPSYAVGLTVRDVQGWVLYIDNYSVIDDGRGIVYYTTIKKLPTGYSGLWSVGETYCVDENRIVGLAI